MERIKRYCLETWQQRPLLVWAAVLVVTGLLAFLRDFSGTHDQPRKNDSNPDQSDGDGDSGTDTFIPDGFVLVPIEVLNYEALDSVLGQFGIVDLFAADPDSGSRTRLIASRVRILRAPRNPSHFAVLAPVEKSSQLVRHDGGYFVVVRNPRNAGTHFESGAAEGGKETRTDVTPPRHRRSRIEVEIPDDM